MREIDPLVTEYQHLDSLPRAADALRTLQKIASIVKPIMRQRGWRVGTLCEFYPDERNLLGLNINSGQRICLRLRHAGDKTQFMPIEDVTDTMLHELCHIVRGPHDEQFHALWNQLREEHESLIRKGYTGEGFLSNGKRLGGARIPMHEARRQARAAAERRRTLNAGSGQKLGGRPVRMGEDIRKVIADAAHRRITVTKGCASGTTEGDVLGKETESNGFKTKAEEDDANERAIMQAYIEMIQEDERVKHGKSYQPPSEQNPYGGTPSTNLGPATPPLPLDTKPVMKSSPSPAAPSSSTVKEDPIDLTAIPDDDFWTCEICTLNNPYTYLVCDACGMEKPAPASPPPARPKPRTNPASRSEPSNSPSSRQKNVSRSAIRSLAALDKSSSAQSKPLGWVCHTCGNFMESEWWTCSSCGSMKSSS